MENNFDFVLPIGYTKGDRIYNKGSMRLATAMDELEIHSSEKMLSSSRYHDILLLSRVITNIGSLSPVTPEMIEDLYEVDFRYLQTLYMQKNGQLTEKITSFCPRCGSLNEIELNGVYKNINYYFNQEHTS